MSADDNVDRQLRRLTRRGFITAGIAAAAGYAAYKWLRTRPREGGLEWPLRRALEINQNLSEAYFSPKRLSPEFPPSRITRPARINGHLGLVPNYDPQNWRLSIEGTSSPVTLTLSDVMSLPHREVITELRCIEGWSIIVKWTGTRLADLMQKFPPRERVQFVGLETPGRGYYVGLDIDSAMHPQTLLAWAINDQPLDWHHGAPLRLAIPIKYGIKSIKRVSLIRYTNVQPADFWAERGYDWYAGH
jgi:DMSO/TMAO reductase YedYZ molybdopterin-dependent catalytic subunit